MSETEEQPTEDETPKQGRKAAIGFILLTLFIDILSIGIIIPVLPELVKEFAGGSTSLAGWYVGIIGASYALMQFFFAPILGALSDRYGRRPVLLVAMFGLGVDFIVQGLAPNLTWLFFGRVFAGIMGASFSTANAYIADISTPKTRARNYGLSGAMFGLGFTFGPAFGGLLGAYSLRAPFFVAAGLSLVNWLYGYFILPESLPPEKRSPFQLSKANPLGSISLLRQYPLVGGIAIAFLMMSLAQRGLENVWVLFTAHKFGWSEFDNGMALGLVGIMAIIVQGGLVSRIISWLGVRQALIMGTIVSVMAFVGYGLATHSWMILAFIVFGALGGVTGPAIQTLVAGEVGSSDQGKVQGALTSLVSLTNIIAPVFFTMGIFSYVTTEEMPKSFAGIPFLVGALLLFLALLVALAVFKKHPKKEEAEENQAALETEEDSEPETSA